MTNEREEKDLGEGETKSRLDECLAHVQEAMRSVGELKWDDARFHLNRIEEIADLVDTSDRRSIDLFRLPVREFVLGFEKLSTAKTPKDQEQAVAHLIVAKNTLRETKINEPDLAKTEGFVVFALGIEGMMLSARIQMAKAQGNPKEANLLSERRNRLISEMMSAYEKDDPRRVALELTALADAAIQEFAKGIQALEVMNLDLARQYLKGAAEVLGKAHERMQTVLSANLIEESAMRVFGGLRLMVDAQHAYVRTLHKAIVGDVDRADVNQLATAEREFVDGAEQITRASSLMPGMFENVDFQALARSAAQLTRNLRALAVRSLKPSQLARTAAPIAVIYFVGTFLILCLALPVSGLVNDLNVDTLGLLLIMSLFISVIGAFGLQATRLVALFDVLARLLPWGREPAKTSAQQLSS